ncbi:sigma-70 family RNA polymerase sigma factor [Salinibacter altiplanensis]|uniref:sigma-70 family RNA polymerase sigma factor n=1 Tax=Salinibacter altiplanensis TaxID=1803181 RepID=UPI000C9F8856|nr:FliA/WhiG family RNA polymerase sigma factor [Salinibacter altiplanensis]
MSRDLQPLVEQYLADPSSSNREAVVMAALPLVRSIIGKINVPDHLLASHEDLESVGIVGLLEALDNYDPEQAQFATHAYRRVRGNVIDYLRSIDVLSRKKRKKMGAVQEALSSLRQMMGEEPSDEDVADYMGMSVGEYHKLLRDAQCRFSLSLSRPSENDDHTMLDVLPSDDGTERFERFEKASAQKHLEDLIQTLPERQQTILGLYYTENLTLQEVGEVLDLSAARISQLLGKIHLTLQSKVEEYAH